MSRGLVQRKRGRSLGRLFLPSSRDCIARGSSPESIFTISIRIKGVRMSESGMKNISSDPTCEEIFTVLSEYIDGELSKELCEAIEAHNGNCPPCQAFVETYTKTIELVRTQPAEPLPSAVKDELSAALKRCQDALDQTR
ncbi:MAG TPA: hypothetical protein EYN18_08730 [Nitrospirales bacterium]|nr:hypothetical protein [Nitrospirales bacterium]HIA15065.1 hypothetical protein [Nitrospirales bacterium]HIB53581.1 hypothetical protein [Nitrospirales bacterium]HIN33309.1 hypothetical protein [Nitrospirales bacterium]HIO22459.1 hypothetical protein [Nitrospirales bacterium]